MEQVSNFIIKQNTQGGLGVFVVSGFIKGDIVLEGNTQSKKITFEEVERLPEKDKHYVGVFDNQFFLLSEPTRYLAHSCNPNLEWIEGIKYAKKNIEQGDELTIDYERGGKPLLSFHCECGEKDCRGFIEGYKKF